MKKIRPFALLKYGPVKDFHSVPLEDILLVINRCDKNCIKRRYEWQRENK